MRGLLIVIAIIIVAIIGIAIWNSSQNSSANQQSNNSQNTIQQTPANSSTSESSSTVQSTSSMTVKLNSQNGFNESGTATVEDRNGKVYVMLQMSGTTSSVPLPAHFHTGTCDNPGNVVYPLNSVMNGRSSTTLNISYQTLLARLPLIINVHKSAQEINTYISCGTAERP